MKRLIVDGRSGPRIEDAAMPVPGADQVLVRTAYSLVSTGTELHYITQCMQSGRRLQLGYCVAGYVGATSTGVDHVRVGEPVIAMGWEYACHAEYVVVPKRLVQPVPEGCDLRKALFANLLATAVHSIDRAALLPQDRLLIVGAGLVGRLVAEAASTVTPHIVMSDLAAQRCGSLARFPAIPSDEMLREPTGWKGQFTKAFFCINGDATAWMRAMPVLLAPRGNGSQRPRIIGVGRYRADMEFSVDGGNLDMVFSARCGEGYRDDDYVHGRRQLEPLPGENTVDANLRRALALIVEERIHLDDLIETPLPFSNLPDFYAVSGAGRFSAIVEYEQAA